MTAVINTTLYTPKAIIVPHWILRSLYTGHWWVGCYTWYSEKSPVTLCTVRRSLGGLQLSPILAVANVTAHPSTASVPVTVLLYDGPLLCGFNVAINGLILPKIDAFEKYYNLVGTCLHHAIAVTWYGRQSSYRSTN